MSTKTPGSGAIFVNLIFFRIEHEGCLSKEVILQRPFSLPRT